jgi:transcriptional regulator with XRE-family HTH domain
MTQPQANIQSLFLETVRHQLPQNLSLADELAELLNISRDSAYRRMRGETVLSLDEAKIICGRYQVSIDSLFSEGSDLVSFKLRVLNSETFPFHKYLQSLYDNLEGINRFENKELIWYAKDLPIWHYFQYPQLSAFKLYFWDKTFVRGSRLRTEKYSRSLVSKELIALGLRVWEKYATVPSTEILNYETLNATLSQIEFAYECGVFNSKDEAFELLDNCSLMLNHHKLQAEEGVKSSHGKAGCGKFNLYLNEVLIGDNSVLFKMDDKRVVFITANQFNILSTSNEYFCRLMEDYVGNMINKSVLISHTSERERSKFFNRMNKKVEKVKERLK